MALMAHRARRFYSGVGVHLKGYQEFKTALGYTSFRKHQWAYDMDRYLLFRGVSSVREIDEALLANWLNAAPSAPGTKSSKLAFIRGFLNYLVRLGLLEQNPALRIPQLKHRAYKPHIYTLKEINAMLEAARDVQRWQAERLSGWTTETMLLLIYACGLRLGEATNLKIKDADFGQDCLELWKTKFHKERIVPFSPVIGEKLKRYLERRRKAFPPGGPGDLFFVNSLGRSFKPSIQNRFRTLVLRSGIPCPFAGKGGPRIHDLRHTFAVHRLYKWYQDGCDIQNKLPLLSTYMGHVNIESTQVYLTITQALLREGDRRFQASFEDITEAAAKRALAKP